MFGRQIIIRGIFQFFICEGMHYAAQDSIWEWEGNGVEDNMRIWDLIRNHSSTSSLLEWSPIKRHIDIFSLTNDGDDTYAGIDHGQEEHQRAVLVPKEGSACCEAV